MSVHHAAYSGEDRDEVFAVDGLRLYCVIAVSREKDTLNTVSKSGLTSYKYMIKTSATRQSKSAGLT